MARRGLLTSVRAAAEIGHEALAGGVKPLDGLGEQRAITDGLDIEGHGVNVGMLGEERHEVGDVHVPLVARTHDVRDADTCQTGPLDDGAADRTALRDHREAARYDRLPLRQHRRHTHRQPAAHSDQASAVRPDHGDAALAREVEERLLQGQAVGSHVREAGRQHESLRYPDVGALLQDTQDVPGRHRDHDHIGYMADVTQRWDSAPAVDFGRTGMDHSDVTLVAVDP